METEFRYQLDQSSSHPCHSWNHPHRTWNSWHHCGAVSKAHRCGAFHDEEGLQQISPFPHHKTPPAQQIQQFSNWDFGIFQELWALLLLLGQEVFRSWQRMESTDTFFFLCMIKSFFLWDHREFCRWVIQLIPLSQEGMDFGLRLVLLYLPVSV